MVRELEVSLKSSLEKCASERQGRIRAQQKFLTNIQPTTTSTVSVCIDIENLSNKMEKKRLYASPDEFQSLIKQVLSWDIGSVSQQS